MTIAGHGLALYEINTGERYDRRCAIARLEPNELAAQGFLTIAKDAARDYKHEFCSNNEWDSVFTAEDLLACAAELAEYYTRHVAEM